MQLRDYQKRSIDMLYEWLRNNSGHVCVVLPTGAGKSVIIAKLCKNALQEWPDTTVLMLCHQKELIEQNAEKMKTMWPNAPMGIYSASVGKRQLGEPITFAGIQSIRNKADLIGHIDICIVDECHCISHKDEGGYRKFLNDLLAINPNMRIIGYSATPYRLGHGLITDKPALFDALIEPVSIEELIFKGHLSILRSKLTKARLSVDGVHKRGGEYIESELQAAVDTDDNNYSVVREVIKFGADRKSWLFFCAGVQHAQHVRDVLLELGINAACVTGETPKAERAQILSDYKAGRIKALTNANVLTTGFDAPCIDLIAMLRPTMSPGLYVQMAGRGLRIAPNKKDCLVLDFAGVVETHGPITNVQPPKKNSEGNGEAPVKVCDNCGELCSLSIRQCLACGNEFPEPVRKELALHNQDIMGIDGDDLEVTEWKWRKHISRTSGKEMLSVTYYGALNDAPVTEYLPVAHDGYAGQKALNQLAKIAASAGIVDGGLAVNTLEQMAANMNKTTPPLLVEYIKEGKFFKVVKRSWKHELEQV